MKPTTPVGALAAALHRDAFPEHATPCTLPDCRLSWRQDVEQAERLLPLLESLGWLPPAPMVALPESAPKGDPATAAASIDDVTDRQWAVWWTLSYFGDHCGGLTDEQLVENYGGTRPFECLQTPQSIRSRRAELVRAGHVVATGERRPTKAGGSAAVWRAAGEAGRAAA